MKILKMFFTTFFDRAIEIFLFFNKYLWYKKRSLLREQAQKIIAVS